MNWLKICAVSVVVMGMISATRADAALLGLQQRFPDVNSTTLDVFYDAETDTFNASGSAGSFAPASGVSYNIVGGPFTLAATIDESGYASAGSLAIEGTISELGLSGTLLTGTLVPGQFGYIDDGGEQFDFVFAVDPSSLLVSNGYWQGDTAAVIITAAFASNSAGGAVPFTGSFASNFDNRDGANVGSPVQYSGDGVSDTFAVPEPAMLSTVGLMSLAALRRRRTA